MIDTTRISRKANFSPVEQAMTTEDARKEIRQMRTSNGCAPATKLAPAPKKIRQMRSAIPPQAMTTEAARKGIRQMRSPMCEHQRSALYTKRIPRNANFRPNQATKSGGCAQRNSNFTPAAQAMATEHAPNANCRPADQGNAPNANFERLRPTDQARACAQRTSPNANFTPPRPTPAPTPRPQTAYGAVFTSN